MTNQVHAKITAADSFYREVIGTVIERSAGWVKVRATRVMDKWSPDFYDHPSSCVTWAKEADVVSL